MAPTDAELEMIVMIPQDQSKLGMQKNHISLVYRGKIKIMYTAIHMAHPIKTRLFSNIPELPTKF